MNKMKTITVVCAAAVCFLAHADDKITYRDAMGRIKGTVTTDRYGKTTYRDYQGRVQSTKTTDRYGKTTYRDASGHVTATETTDRYGKTTYRDCLGAFRELRPPTATARRLFVMPVGAFKGPLRPIDMGSQHIVTRKGAFRRQKNEDLAFAWFRQGRLHPGINDIICTGRMRVLRWSTFLRWISRCRELRQRRRTSA